MIRRRRAQAPRPGDMVIDGHVRARLLGVKLLELDAHIVVGEAGEDRRLGGTPTLTAAPPAALAPSAGRAGGDGALRDRDALPLARAQRLLAEGTTVLAGARRIR